MAKVSLSADAGIRARFDASVLKAGSVACAICSVQTTGGRWIICPRRLLNFTDGQVSKSQSNLLKTVMSAARIPSGAKVAVWKEITVDQKRGGRKFKYRFDYVVREILYNHTYGPPNIIEVMTCSTSGGNKEKGTDIATAFRKSLLADQGDKIMSPNVNIRQVWSRMAGQMIVKSQAANAWGGRAIWVVQDLLANYISANTGLDLEDFATTESSEVNIVSSNGTYGDAGKLYAGPISGNDFGGRSFSDLLKASFVPNFDAVESKVRLDTNPDGEFVVPEPHISPLP